MARPIYKVVDDLPRFGLTPALLGSLDWVVPGDVPSTAVTDPGNQARSSRLLVTAVGEDGKQHLADASPDLMQYEVVPVRDDLVPSEGRWSPDRSEIAFTAKVPYNPDAPAPPWPPAPPTRRRWLRCCP